MPYVISQQYSGQRYPNMVDSDRKAGNVTPYRHNAHCQARLTMHSGPRGGNQAVLRYGGGQAITKVRRRGEVGARGIIILLLTVPSIVGPCRGRARCSLLLVGRDEGARMRGNKGSLDSRVFVVCQNGFMENRQIRLTNIITPWSTMSTSRLSVMLMRR